MLKHTPLLQARTARQRKPVPFLRLALGMGAAGLIALTSDSLKSAEGDSDSPSGGAKRGFTAEARVPSDATATDPLEFFKRGQFAESSKDFAQARKMYRRGAVLGHAPSQNNLGYLMLRGLGGAAEPEEAVKWFRDAARQNYAPAQNNMGVCYRDGTGVKEDQSAAAKWFMQAAEQGMAEAQNNLGVRFYRGMGMPKNTDAAIQWFTKAADQGLPSAWINLGICYVEGRGFPKDLNKAYEYFYTAAQKGDADGLLDLGFAYMEGKGVPKDYVRAYVCFDAAVATGDTYAPQARSRLRGMMTEKQVAEAQRRTYERSRKTSESQ